MLSVLHASCVTEMFIRWDTVDAFGTGELGNVPLTNSGKLRKIKMPGGVKKWTLTAHVKNTEENWWAGTNKLQHDITCDGSWILSDINPTKY
jgi:hypothetical protein